MLLVAGAVLASAQKDGGGNGRLPASPPAPALPPTASLEALEAEVAAKKLHEAALEDELSSATAKYKATKASLAQEEQVMAQRQAALVAAREETKALEAKVATARDNEATKAALKAATAAKEKEAATKAAEAAAAEKAKEAAATVAAEKK